MIRKSIAVGIALLLTFAVVAAAATDSRPEPRPIGDGFQTFEAPADPPEPGEAADVAPVSEPEGSLQLADALALALMHNPELQAFSWETRASEARALQAGKPPNPEIDVRVYQLGIPRASVIEDSLRWRAVLSQAFELGGKGKKRFRLAEADARLTGWDYEGKRIEVVTEVTAEFVEVLGAQRREAALRGALDYVEEIRGKVVELVDSGALRSLEIHEVARQTGLARIDHQRAASELATARFRLAASWGSTAPRFAEAIGDLELVLPVPDLDGVLAMARRSPAVVRWDDEHARGEAALRLAKSGRVPDVTLGAGVRWQEHKPDEDLLVDVEISLPILDRKQGDIREARHDMARAKAGRQAAEAATAARVAELYYLLEESDVRQRTLWDEVLPAVRATLEAYRTGLDRAAVDVEDVLDARRDLARAEAAHTDALVDYHRTLAALEGLLGESLTD